MTSGIQSIDLDMPLIVAARVMDDTHLDELRVIDQQRPVGILSHLDVVAALVNAFDEAKGSI